MKSIRAAGAIPSKSSPQAWLVGAIVEALANSMDRDIGGIGDAQFGL
jgi:hypothetical protein